MDRTHLAKITAQYVPPPIISNDPLAPTACPNKLKTKKFKVDSDLTRLNEERAPGERLELST
jgi:hypothetical protein